MTDLQSLYYVNQISNLDMVLSKSQTQTLSFENFTCFTTQVTIWNAFSKVEDKGKGGKSSLN